MEELPKWLTGHAPWERHTTGGKMDEVTIKKEDLSEHDCGGAIRVVTAVITVDETQPVYRQCLAVTYEILGAYLSNIVSHEVLDDIAQQITQACDELRRNDGSC